MTALQVQACQGVKGGQNKGGTVGGGELPNIQTQMDNKN